MAQLLKFVNSIAFTNIKNLESVLFIPGRGVIVDNSEFEELPLIELAKMELTSSEENKTRQFRTVISATICKPFDARCRYFSFIVSCVNGERFLVGTTQQPFPKVSTSDVFPDWPTVSAGCSITVELVDSIGLLPIIG